MFEFRFECEGELAQYALMVVGGCTNKEMVDLQKQRSEGLNTHSGIVSAKRGYQISMAHGSMVKGKMIVKTG